MAFKQKGFPMHRSASALKHKKDTDHRHGSGYVPKEYRDELREYKQSLIEQGMVIKGKTDLDQSSPTYGEYVRSEGEKLLNQRKDEIKAEIGDPTMPTRAQIKEQGLSFGNIPDTGQGGNVIEVTGEVTGTRNPDEIIQKAGKTQFGGNVPTEKGKERKAYK